MCQHPSGRIHAGCGAEDHQIQASLCWSVENLWEREGGCGLLIVVVGKKISYSVVYILYYIRMF